MRNRKFIYTSLAFLFLLVIILATIIFFTHKKDLRVVFFDVGQGDVILISEGSQQVLIDGG
jgi:beta-lactamase superfamily II metal-dependent hydrolase